jgi:diaminopimelate decarboxylase
MNYLNNFSNINSEIILKARAEFGTPIYLYDEELIIKKCKSILSMPNAFGIRARYAMKANSNKTILQIITDQGINIDASSLNEVRRAEAAGIKPCCIMMTSQEVPEDDDRRELEELILRGLKYNVCSLRQLYLIGSFAKENNIELSVRLHPGIGSGESATRNTGDNYSCFGIHLTDLDEMLCYADQLGLKFTQVHVHIGSGGDPEMWRKNIDLELGLVEKNFPDVNIVSFGGGLKESRMPNEIAADINALGKYASDQINRFYKKTRRKIMMEIEPGTFIVANSGYVMTKVLDKKQTGPGGQRFLIVNGGMDVNTRPLLYGSKHPFYIISKNGQLLSSDFKDEPNNLLGEMVVVGTCCESGDSLCLDFHGNSIPRRMAEPEINDIVIVGGVGAYCSSMAPFNYNSHTQISEVILKTDGELKLIRRKQTLQQIMQNEL